MRFLSLALVLAAFWLLLSGYFKPLLLGFGVFTVVFVLWMGKRMNLVDEEGHPVELVGGSLGYFLWLAKEIVLSTINVTKIVLSPSLPISPVVKRVPVSQKSELGVNIYANSITLTPGTMTVRAAKDSLLIHALTEEGIEDLEEGTMDRKVSQFEAKRS